MKYIKRLILLLSYSILFTFSADENFGTINSGNFDSAKKSGFRFSIFSLKLATVAVYFFSWRNKQFSFFYKINLIDLTKIIDYEDVDNAYINLGERLLGKELLNFSLIGIDLTGQKKKQRIQLIGEFYQNKCNALENSFSQTFNKCLAYIAIVAFIVPFYFSYLTSLDEIPRLVFVFLIIIMLYLLINILGLLISFLKVMDYKYLNESALYQINDLDVARTLMYFYNAKVGLKKSNHHVSLIKNLGKYIVFIVSIVFSTWAIFFVLNLSDNKIKEASREEQVSTVEEIYTVTELKLDLSSEKSFLNVNKEALDKLNLKGNKTIDQILIFHSPMTPEVLNKQFKAYIDISTNTLKSVFLLDEDLSIGQYKLIVVRSKNK